MIRGHQPVGHDRLKLDRLRAGLGGAANHFLGTRKAAFVVVADFGNDKNLTFEVDGADQHAAPWW